MMQTIRLALMELEDLEDINSNVHWTLEDIACQELGFDYDWAEYELIVRQNA